MIILLHVLSGENSAEHAYVSFQDSKRSSSDFAGRNDGNTIVILPKEELATANSDAPKRVPQPGDYVAVEVRTSSGRTTQTVCMLTRFFVFQITDCSSLVLKGKPLYLGSLKSFDSENASVLCEPFEERSQTLQRVTA